MSTAGTNLLASCYKTSDHDSGVFYFFQTVMLEMDFAHRSTPLPSATIPVERVIRLLKMRATPWRPLWNLVTPGSPSPSYPLGFTRSGSRSPLSTTNSAHLYSARYTLQRKQHAMSTSTESSSSFVDQRVRATYKWFESVVVGEKLCPFAPPLHQNPGLMHVVCAPANANRRQSIELLHQEAQALVSHQHLHHDHVHDQGEDTAATDTTNAATTTPLLPKHETTLVVLDSPEWSRDFREFIRFSWDLQEQVIEQANLLGTLQLVFFHPLATHQTYGMIEGEGGSTTNPGDYTIRSPYPTVHLLREVDVLRAVQGGYPSLETLPARNQAKLIQQGIETCRRRLADCYTFAGAVRADK